MPINPKPCKILLYRPTCDRMDLQRPKSNNKQRARIIIVLLLVCARRSTAINSRVHAVVSHTHTTRSNNAYEYYEEGKSMGTYIFQAEVFLSLWYVDKKTLCLLLSPCTDTRGSASKRNESAGETPSRTSYATPQINERERRRNRAAIGCEMCFFLYYS